MSLASRVFPARYTVPGGEQGAFSVSADLPKGLTFYALDLETTGFSPAKDYITEIAWGKFQGGFIVGKYSTLVRPSEQATRAQIAFACDWLGVTETELFEAPSLEEVLSGVLADLEGQQVAVHSGTRFDERFLERESELAGMSFPQI